MAIRTTIYVLFVVLMFLSSIPSYAKGKQNLQAGLGFGAVSPYPISGFPYALQGVLEGTYRYKSFGLSLLATATSSPKVGGTYWFDSNGNSQQALIEPRLYLTNWIHAGLVLGVNIAGGGTSGEIESFGSYGGMAGIEIPLGRFSFGADARYLMAFSGTNPTPFAAVAMLRFKL